MRFTFFHNFCVSRVKPPSPKPSKAEQDDDGDFQMKELLERIREDTANWKAKDMCQFVEAVMGPRFSHLQASVDKLVGVLSKQSMGRNPAHKRVGEYGPPQAATALEYWSSTLW